MIGSGIMLAMAGIIVLIAGAAQAAQNRFYATGSETVLGTVTYKRSHKTKVGTAYELTVSYIVNGISYEKVVGSSYQEYEAIAKGEEIELRYKSDNPKKAVRSIEQKPRNVRIILVIGTVLIVAGIAILYIGRIM